ncbi:MAG: bifunctional UDP-N-acetylmuramoyl-tripeptide:D-alanyl-D-alanine ligase/alanine racemase [Bacteroidales bacterium]
MATAYSLHEIIEATSGRLVGQPPPGLSVGHLLTDSRRLVVPQATAFFALVTQKNNGHRYIAELQQKGVRCFVVSQLPAKPAPDTAYVLVDDTLQALQNLAAWHRCRFSLPVVGITGSNGKTIVKEWLSQLLADQWHVVKNPRSYNSQTGVPLSVWQINAAHELGVFEAGISKPGEMTRLQRIIRPTHGIFTNIGPAHDEGFVSREQKILEKLNLFSQSELLVYHSDNEVPDQIIRQWSHGKPTLRLFRWGKEPGNDMQLINMERKASGSRLQLRFRGAVQEYFIPFTDDASLENAMHCVAYLNCQGYDPAWIAKGLLRLQPMAMRLELRQGINQCTLINDAYNSDLLSLGIALDFLFNQVRSRRKTLILSDILQAGIEPEKLYEQVAVLLQARRVDALIGIGPDISNHAHCFANFQASFYPDTESFLASADLYGFQNEGILLKGARDFGFERISNALQYKDHQTLLEIDLDALVHNLNVYKSMLHPGVKITAMVKAFSYGSGSFEIASVLQYHQVDYLAVAFADEGKELRNAGITMPIMVLNPELHNLDILFRYKLEPEIYSLELLQRLAAAGASFASQGSDDPFRVHLKLDTGMHRLGFLEHELDALIQGLKQYPWMRVATVFSHFSASDLPEFDDFSIQQMETFRRMADKLEENLGYPFLRHMANSAAISRLPESQFDMVRLGIGLYGVDPSAAIARLLRNVTTFKTVISQIKTVAAGQSVGYNRAAMLEKETQVAIVPVGYADGLNRRLSNGKGYMLVGGKKAPVLGNISMDMCCLDVTGLGARQGDEVIIFGEDLPVTRLARKLGTIPYEVFTSIAARVKRVYYQE